MKSKTSVSVRSLVRYSLVASLASLLQVSGAFFPGPGHVLSAFSALPMAVAAFMSPWGGVTCFAVSAFLTFILQPAASIIFTLCNAPLGFVIGWGLHHSHSTFKITLIGTVVLTTGMLILTFGLGFPVFGPFPVRKHLFTLLPLYIGLAFLYTYAWLRFSQSMLKRLVNIGLKP